MNREIAELREVVNKLVPMLTGRGLKVTQRGSQAYVQANTRTMKPEIINIPSIPDNATPGFIAAIGGFIDHEVGHVLFTDWKYYGGDGIRVKRHSVEGRALANAHNIFEDTLVEREMVKVFPGSRKNLQQLWEHFTARITQPALDDVRGDQHAEFSVLFVPFIRALSGQKHFQDFMDAGNHWEQPLIREIHLALSDETLELIKTAKTTRDTLRAAQEVHDIMFNRPEPVAPKPEPEEKPEEKPEDEPKPADEEEQGDAQADDQDDQGEADETGEDEGQDDADQDDASDDAPADDSAGGDGDEPEPDADDAGDADGDGGSSSEDDHEGGDQDGADAATDEDPAAGDDEPAGDAGDDEPMPQDGGESDGAGDDEAADDLGAGTPDGDDGDAEDRGEDTAAEPGQAHQSEDDENDQDRGGFGLNGDPDADDGDGDDSSSGVARGLDEEEEEEEAGEEEDETAGGSYNGTAEQQRLFGMTPDEFDPVDLSRAVSLEISEMMSRALDNAPYSTFTRDEDVIAFFDPEAMGIDVKPEWVTSMEETVQGMVGTMQKEVERMMAAQARVMTTPGHRRGRLHSPSLFRVLQNDPRVFSQREEIRKKDTAVTLLVDNSGSMTQRGEIVVALQSAYALAATLDRVGIPNEVLGFTTEDLSPEMQQRAVHDPNFRKFSRTCAIVMPIFKAFSEKMTPVVKRRLAAQIHAQRGMQTNVDGESLEYAALRLLARKEKRKVMLVMSDGMPVGDGTERHLAQTVKKLTGLGIETVGMGIGTDSVRAFYPRWMILDDVAALPTTVMGELKRILAA